MPDINEQMSGPIFVGDSEIEVKAATDVMRALREICQRPRTAIERAREAAFARRPYTRMFFKKEH